jgi:hypothetical protein
MYNPLQKLAIAIAALWVLAVEETVEFSTYHVYADDIEDGDSMADSRLSGGKHLEVTVRVVENDDEYNALFARHLARQKVSDVALMEADETR